MARKVCSVCTARDGQRVFRARAPQHWRVFMPGPPEGTKGHPQAVERDAFSQKFVHDGDFYEPALRNVEVGEGGMCAWCREHLAGERPDPPCPRCQHHGPPPGDPVPCPLCGGDGMLRGAKTQQDVVDRILAAFAQPSKMETPCPVPADPAGLPAPANARRRRVARDSRRP